MSNLLSNSEVEKMKKAAISKNIVSRRIAELCTNILLQVILKTKYKTFSQSSLTKQQLLLFSLILSILRRIHKRHLKNEFLFFESLYTKTKASDIVSKLDRFFEKHNV